MAAVMTRHRFRMKGKKESGISEIKTKKKRVQGWLPTRIEECGLPVRKIRFGGKNGGPVEKEIFYTEQPLRWGFP